MSVCIVGWSHTPFGRLDQMDFEQLVSTAAAGAIAHAGIDAAELFTYEAMGLTEPGAGARALLDGTVQPDGALPVNVSGGLKAKGHPIGATGVSMHVLAAMQLTGSAGDMQIPGANLGAVFNMGGMAVANYVNILERIQ